VTAVVVFHAAHIAVVVAIFRKEIRGSTSICGSSRRSAHRDGLFECEITLRNLRGVAVRNVKDE
jgi:hypothetical protein